MTPAVPLVGAALALLLLGALGAVVAARRDRAAFLLGMGGALAGCAVGVGAALWALLDGTSTTLRVIWPLPLGRLALGLDPVSSFFLLALFVVCGLGALFAVGYLRGAGRPLAGTAALIDLLIASMAGVVLARDGVLLLACWEAMSLTSFLLVLFDGERGETRRAAMVYLVASHIGALPLFVVFVLLAAHTGSFEFASLAAAGPLAAGLSGALLLLGLVGFGTKAGLWPVHVWLPEAHPAAPSPVSAMMSGVMIKMGVYGLLRLTMLLGPPPAWWGVTLIVVGVVSGLAGVLHALAQHDLKRLLAYHSVENIGIIALGLGLGFLGQAEGQPVMAFLGHGGAVLHVLNHGLFKGLLFQGAGSVQHGAGTRDADSLGGLARSMPVTSTTFLVGAVAISGLPPLNGFVSELLVYTAAFTGAVHLPAASGGWALAAIPSLALIGGLAAACFVKVYGVVFLGSPRSEAAAHAHEGGRAMGAAMVVGAGLCLLIGLWPQGALRLIGATGRQLTGTAAAPAAVEGMIVAVSRIGLLLAAVVVGLALLRRLLLRGRDLRRADTWGCGYEAPTPRMQYTAASFADPVLRPFHGVFERHERRAPVAGDFPAAATHEGHLDDRADGALRGVFASLLEVLSWPLRLDGGQTRRYLAYILVTLVALLVWQLAL